MFGLFKNSKSEKIKTCDQVELSIQEQLSKVREEKVPVFKQDIDGNDDTEESIFFNTYLTNLLWFTTYNKGMDTKFLLEDDLYPSYIINKMQPDFLFWFQNTQGLIKMTKESIEKGETPAFDFKSLIEEAKDAANYDSDLLNSGDDINLYRFLTGKELLTYNE